MLINLGKEHHHHFKVVFTHPLTVYKLNNYTSTVYHIDLKEVYNTTTSFLEDHETYQDWLLQVLDYALSQHIIPYEVTGDIHQSILTLDGINPDAQHMVSTTDFVDILSAPIILDEQVRHMSDFESNKHRRALVLWGTYMRLLHSTKPSTVVIDGKWVSKLVDGTIVGSADTKSASQIALLNWLASEAAIVLPESSIVENTTNWIHWMLDKG